MLLAPDFRRRFHFLHTGLCILIDDIIVAIKALRWSCLGDEIGRCPYIAIVVSVALMVDVVNVGSGNDGICCL